MFILAFLSVVLILHHEETCPRKRYRVANADGFTREVEGYIPRNNRSFAFERELDIAEPVQPTRRRLLRVRRHRDLHDLGENRKRKYRWNRLDDDVEYEGDEENDEDDDDDEDCPPYDDDTTDECPPYEDDAKKENDEDEDDQFDEIATEPESAPLYFIYDEHQDSSQAGFDERAASGLRLALLNLFLAFLGQQWM